MKTTKHHYVYKITNNNPTDERKYYIGVRTPVDCLPEEDTKYMGSSKYLKESIKEIGLEHFSKEILSTWNTREEALAEEIRLHEYFDVSINKEFYNKVKQTSIGFDTEGFVTVFDKIDNKRKNIPKSVYDNDKENYIFNTAGNVAVLDKRDNKTKSITIDEFKRHNYYVSHLKNTITVLDIRDGKTKRVNTDDFHKFNYYISPTKNKVSVIDKSTGKSIQVTKDEFKNNDNLRSINKNKIVVIDNKDGKRKSINVATFNKNKDRYTYFKSKKIKIFDNNDNLIYTVQSNFATFCDKNNIPRAFIKSYQNNGQRLYTSKKAFSVKDEFLKYKNWYAIKEG